MKSYHQMSEVEFIESLDSTYDIDKLSEEQAKEIVEVGLSFSDNATTMVLLMLSRSEGNAEKAIRYINLLKERDNSDIVDSCIDLAERLVENKDVDKVKLLSLSELCRKHPGNYNALNLILDADDSMTAMVENIISEWKSNDAA